MKIKLLVTGKDGFIGKNISEYYCQKYSLTLIGRKDLDLTDTTSVDKYFKKHGNFDVIVHAANSGGLRNNNDSPNVVDDNLRMFFNLERNKKHFKKLINLGSGAEFFHNLEIKNANEEFNKNGIPSDYYGFSKYVCSKFTENTNNFINLRLFAVFGKYEDYKLRFISNNICRAIYDKNIVIEQNRKIDYLYIDDFLKILSFFIENNTKYRSYNIGSGKPIELVDLAKLIKNICNSNKKIIIRDKKMGNEYSCNISRTYGEIPKIAFTPFNQSISELYKWYLENKKMINKDLI